MNTLQFVTVLATGFASSPTLSTTISAESVQVNELLTAARNELSSAINADAFAIELENQKQIKLLTSQVLNEEVQYTLIAKNSKETTITSAE